MTRTIMMIAALLLSACATQPEPAGNGLVTGTALIPGDGQLAADAVFEVSLQDVSLADAQAVNIAYTNSFKDGQNPIHFELSYPLAAINRNHSYSLRVKVMENGQLAYINDTSAPVITRGSGQHADIKLVRVGGSSAGPVAGMPLQGMFTYMADAATFTDCRDGRTYPVSMEAQYAELENMYLSSDLEPGAALMVDLDGRYLERPSMEGNNNKVKLIVDNIKVIYRDKACQPDLHADLRNTFWRLVEVNGLPVATPDGVRAIHMVLETDQNEDKVRGFSGCNTFFGAYRQEGSSLSFSGLGATMMTCPAVMETEQAFLAALGEASSYLISGDFLELHGENGVLARFEAVLL